METDDESKYYYYEHLSSNDNSYNTPSHLITSSSTENAANFFFTTESKRFGWNSKSQSNTTLLPAENVRNDDVFEDQVVGKSFDAFESKLQQGFLEAPNLGLVSAPPAMFDYQPPLRRIDLKDNKIEILPEHFFDELPQLYWCDLRYNRLNCIPQITIEHPNLQVLLLQNNRLTALPYSIARAKQLHTLGWSNNDISDPPPFVLLQGCKSILDYMGNNLESEHSVEELVNFEHDEQLAKDLKKTLKKQTAKRTKSRNSLISEESKTSANATKEDEERKRRIDRLKYTWNLWKSIPYNGVSQHSLFEQSVREVKDDVQAKLNQHRNAILQKMKDNDALGKWRWETRMLQVKGPEKPYNGVQIPFGTDADIAQQTGNGYQEVDASTFRTNMTECMKRLQLLAENPIPISDTDKSLERLKEVEDIQRKLFDMKLKWSVKSSNPI